MRKREIRNVRWCTADFSQLHHQAFTQGHDAFLRLGQYEYGSAVNVPITIRLPRNSVPA
jgi:hypothetical protein